MFHDLRRQPSRFADFFIEGVVRELKRKQFKRQFIKFDLVGAGVRRLILSFAAGSETPRVVSSNNGLAQTRGEAGKVLVHAVFDCRLVIRHSR